MLDINLFREDSGGNPQFIKESQRRRFASVEIVDEVISLDQEWRQTQKAVDDIRKEINAANKESAARKKQDKTADISDIKEKVEKLKEDLQSVQQRNDELKGLRDSKLQLIGNIVHDTVPVSDDEENNGLIRTWGEHRKEAPEELWHHHELLFLIDGFNSEKGVDVAGHRGYFLKGVGVQLNQALINFALNFLVEKGYTPLQTPYFMRKDRMAQVAQLEQFDEELYHVSGDGDDKYLIATSEQTIAGYHCGENFNEKELPVRYAGFSTCFRKEAGAHGKDTWGIFRVHQFDKVEQFCVTAPENSWDEHEKMLAVSEEFFQALNIPYRVVAIVSGELNNAAAKKYDLEGWFPAFGEHRELVSCSNCTDYQARRLNCTMGTKQAGTKTGRRFVHMLNSTLCACTRTICAILENNQTDTGVEVPEVLRPYMGNKAFLPFVNKPKKNMKKGKLPQ